jgi:hypothetical protein
MEENEGRLIAAIDENQRQIDAALSLREQIRKEQPEIPAVDLNKLL